MYPQPSELQDSVWRAGLAQGILCLILSHNELERWAIGYNYPLKLLQVDNIFHVSQLHKYIKDPSHIIKPDPVQL